MGKKKTGLENWGDAFEQRPARNLLKLGVIGIIICFVLGALLMVLGVISMPARTAKAIAEKTFDADNVIHNYEWFKRQHEAHGEILGRVANHQANLDQFEADAGERSTWDRYDKEEHSRLRAIVTGQKDQLLALVKEYNARSKMANRSIFKTGDGKLIGDGGSLPESLPQP